MKRTADGVDTITYLDGPLAGIVEEHRADSIERPIVDADGRVDLLYIDSGGQLRGHRLFRVSQRT